MVNHYMVMVVKLAGHVEAILSAHELLDCACNAYTTDITKLIYARVSNRKGLSMQNKFVSVLSSRSTLGKIETTLQIGYTLGKVREKAILNHKPKYKKKWLRDQNYVHRGRRTSRSPSQRSYLGRVYSKPPR